MRTPYYNNVKTTDPRPFILFVQTLVLIFLLLFNFLYLSSVNYIHANALIYPASVTFLAIFVWSLWAWRSLTNSLFDPYALFFIAAVLFSGGHAILEVFGLNENGVLFNRFSAITTIETLFLVTLGLVSFHLGALIVAATRKPLPAKEDAEGSHEYPSPHDIRMIGWGLLLISLIPTLMVLTQAISVVMVSGYSGIFRQEAAISFGAWPQILSGFLIPAALFLLAGSGRRKHLLIVSGIVVLSYAVVQFFIGARLWAATPLIAYAWLWDRSVRPLPRVTLVSLALVIIFVIFPLVKVTRHIVGEERLDTSLIMDSFFSIEAPAIAAISEIGNSMATIAYTVELVPTVRDYDRGVGYLYALLSVVPNLSWDIHPATAHSPSYWLIREVDPYRASVGGGLGYSFIAEAYLNFGWVGAPVALGLIGFFLGGIILWAAKSQDPTKWALVASFLNFSLIYPRGEAALVVRPLIWYAFFPYLAVVIITGISKRLPRTRRRL